MMSLKDIETQKFIAEVWRMNDERNKRIEAEKRINKLKFANIDDAIQE